MPASACGTNIRGLALNYTFRITLLHFVTGAMAGPPRFQGIPDIVYGTAFKFEKSASLVEAALKAGFRAIDTAGSKSAYREARVGEGIAAAQSSGKIERSELYVSTRFKAPYIVQ